MGIGPRPQIIAIQEAWASMFNVYKDELYQQTGQVWNGVFATHCASVDWNGSSCNRDWYQGVAIFSSFPINDSSSTMFAYADCWTSARAGLRASVNVNGINVQVFI